MKPAREHYLESGVLDGRLANELVQLKTDLGTQRLRIFRNHLGRRLRIASPLLLSACGEGELDEAMRRLRPGEKWPFCGPVRLTVRGWSSRSAHHGPVRVVTTDAETGMTVTIQDQLSLRVTSRSANMVLWLGNRAVRTTDSGGLLFLPRLVNTDEANGMIGRPLGDLFDHPATESGLFPIAAVRPDRSGRRTVAEFVCPPEEWRAPWARPADF